MLRWFLFYSTKRYSVVIFVILLPTKFTVLDKLIWVVLILRLGYTSVNQVMRRIESNFRHGAPQHCDQCNTSTFYIIDVPFTGTEHLFIFMNFTNFSICAGKCIYSFAASYLHQYNLCKSWTGSWIDITLTDYKIF